jgi:carnitine-CoA ligase
LKACFAVLDTGSKNPVASRLVSVPQLVVDAAERFGDAPFLTAAVPLSFRDAARAVSRAAGAIHDRGVRPGERVVLSAENGPVTVLAWLGAIHAGAIPAAINPALTEPEIAYVLDDLQPRLALFDAKSAAGAPGTAAAARAVPVADIATLDRGAPVPPHAADPADAAAIVYTSGTTSRPKGALVRHLAYVGAGQSMPAWIGLGAGERIWSILPFFHINAQAYSLMSALANGYPLTISEKFRASTFWRDAAALGVTEVNVIGAMLAILARQPEEMFEPGPLRLVYAAPALEPAENQRFEGRFGVRIASGFGMSENVFGCIESTTSRAKASCIGRPRQHPDGLIHNELRIVTPEGEVAAAGTVGELQFRNAAVTPGYWNAPEITARTLLDGWLHTGDAGYLDADGDVVLVARYKEMIRRRGENIAPGEVEDALLLHPGVAQAAVVGVPSSLTEEDVVAAVVRRAPSDVDGEELRAWCAARLAPYKVPSRIVFLDAFPLTATMRVAKDRLKAEIAPLLANGAPHGV